MDLGVQTIAQALPPYIMLDHINNGLTNDHDLPLACGLCGRTILMENEGNNFQSVSICDDCKFLLLEDFASPAHNSLRQRLRGRRSSINGGSDSIQNFSQQFSQIINLARHIEPENEDVHGDADLNVMALQPASSRSTPIGSRRWQRMFSETESDGFNSDSFYGESESNVSTGAYRVYHGDSDAISFSSYEGDSGASVDGHTYVDTDIYLQSIERSDIGSDSDIDPMHAGTVHWNFDEDGIEDVEWEEADAEDAVGPREWGTHFNSSAGSDHFVEHNSTDYSEIDGTIHRRIREVRNLQIPSFRMSVEEFSELSYSGNPNDYLDAEGFEEFLENVAETDNSRRGAPPTASSFIDNMPLILISEEHLKPDGLACAICKDLLMIGTEVNQLPCFHRYHPSCILPWLRARNSCPLCRYELPTDDRDYELGKQNANHRMAMSEIPPLEDRDDSASVTTDVSEIDVVQNFSSALGDVGPAVDISQANDRRGGLLFLAAAPIVSLAGIVCILWLRNSNPFGGRRGLTGQPSLNCPSHRIQSSGLCPRNQGVRRSWWWWF